MVAAEQITRGWSSRRLNGPILLLWAGLVAVAVPTLIRNAQQNWALEQGQQAPIALVLGLWLLWRQWPSMRAVGAPGRGVVLALAGAPSIALYVLGRVSQQYTMESYGLYGLCVTIVYGVVGGAGVKQGGFALAYLLFALPLPYTVVWMLTAHLRLWVTEASVSIARLLGLSIVRDGLNILVDQYELAVQEACSGMNSLFSLSAVGFLYLQLRRSPPGWYILVMAGPIVAFALFGNLVRILCLIGLTHFFGDAVAQSFLHESAGLLTFATALLGVMGLDALLAPRFLQGRGKTP